HDDDEFISFNSDWKWDGESGLINLAEKEELFRLRFIFSNNLDEWSEDQGEGGDGDPIPIDLYDQTVDVPRRKYFDVRFIRVIVQWAWQMIADNCPLCRHNIHEYCSECFVTVDAEQCPISWGACAHSYHTHCINRWLSSNDPVCPLDKSPWEFRPSVPLI